MMTINALFEALNTSDALIDAYLSAEWINGSDILIKHTDSIDCLVIRMKDGYLEVFSPVDLDQDFIYGVKSFTDLIELLTAFNVPAKIHRRYAPVGSYDVIFGSADERVFWYLSKNTHMLKSEIKRQIADGVGVYQDNQVGYNEFRENCLAGLCDEDDVLDMWEALDIVGDYRFDWVL